MTTSTDHDSSPAVSYKKKAHRAKRSYKRTRKPLDVPKRPLSAYNFFFQEKRAELTAEQEERERAGTVPEDGNATENMSGSMAKQIALMWRTLSDSDREKYTTMAANDSLRHEAEMQVYYSGREKPKGLTEELAAQMAAKNLPSVGLGGVASSPLDNMLRSRLDQLRTLEAALSSSIAPLPSHTLSASLQDQGLLDDRVRAMSRYPQSQLVRAMADEALLRQRTLALSLQLQQQEANERRDLMNLRNLDSLALQSIAGSNARLGLTSPSLLPASRFGPGGTASHARNMQDAMALLRSMSDRTDPRFGQFLPDWESYPMGR